MKWNVGKKNFEVFISSLSDWYIICW